MKRLIAALMLVPVLASAEPQLREEDWHRVNDLDRALTHALNQAFAGGSPDDVAALTDALAGVHDGTLWREAEGTWSCRTMKLGDTLPLVVYGWFECRIKAAGGALWFEKVSGSQRVRGKIVPWGDDLILSGVGYIAGDSPPGYADLPPEIDTRASPQRTADPARFEMMSPIHARLLFPQPMLESDFDILELRR